MYLLLLVAPPMAKQEMGSDPWFKHGIVGLAI